MRQGPPKQLHPWRAYARCLHSDICRRNLIQLLSNLAHGFRQNSCGQMDERRPHKLDKIAAAPAAAMAQCYVLSWYCTAA